MRFVNKIKRLFSVVGEITSVVYLTGERGKYVEVLKNPTPYAFHQVMRHLSYNNDVRGIINNQGDIWLWDGELTHDAAQAQLELGKCTQFVIYNHHTGGALSRQIGFVSFMSEDEHKNFQESIRKNIPSAYELNPNLKRLGLTFRENEKAA